MAWQIENANINIQSKFHVPTIICFRVAPKTKISKTDFAYKFSFFLNFSFVFHGALENYWKNFTFDPPKYQLDSLSYQKDTVEENPSTFTVLNDRQKK